jgi:hypothetical protein
MWQIEGAIALVGRGCCVVSCEGGGCLVFEGSSGVAISFVMRRARAWTRDLTHLLIIDQFSLFSMEETLGSWESKKENTIQNQCEDDWN